MAGILNDIRAGLQFRSTEKEQEMQTLTSEIYEKIHLGTKEKVSLSPSMLLQY